MKKNIGVISAALGLLVATCSATAAQPPDLGEVDAALIPESQRESRYEVSISMQLMENPKDISLRPVPKQAAIYRQVRPAAGLTTKPRRRLQTLPDYPHELAVRGIPGRVVVAYVAGADGHVRDPKIIEASDERFAHAVVESVPRWLYVPGTLNGRAVPAVLVIEVTFQREIDRSTVEGIGAKDTRSGP